MYSSHDEHVHPRIASHRIAAPLGPAFPFRCCLKPSRCSEERRTGHRRARRECQSRETDRSCPSPGQRRWRRDPATDPAGLSPEPRMASAVGPRSHRRRWTRDLMLLLRPWMPRVAQVREMLAQSAPPDLERFSRTSSARLCLARTAGRGPSCIDRRVWDRVSSGEISTAEVLRTTAPRTKPARPPRRRRER